MLYTVQHVAENCLIRRKRSGVMPWNKKALVRKTSMSHRKEGNIDESKKTADCHYLGLTLGVIPPGIL